MAKHLNLNVCIFTFSYKTGMNEPEKDNTFTIPRENTLSTAGRLSLIRDKWFHQRLLVRLDTGNKAASFSYKIEIMPLCIMP